MGDVTKLLGDWAGGDKEALDELMPLVYRELHRIASRFWAVRTPGQTLQPTALIHEAYLKLASDGERTYDSRAHFFAVASMAMRQILVNRAEARAAEKRGGGRMVPLDDADAAAEAESVEVLALDQALRSLEKIDPRKCRVVELRYFGGLGVEETAEALGISTVTVTRDWQAARAWLARELGGR
jgi:RNA polymerase sigma factor (TIGR02999 family)